LKVSPLSSRKPSPSAPTYLVLDLTSKSEDFPFLISHFSFQFETKTARQTVVAESLSRFA
jgi:hypothetical protein